MFSKKLTLVLFITLFIRLDISIAAKEQASVGEVFIYKIDSTLFNWTKVISEQFRYRASLKGYPDLPSWMRYMYSHEHHAGFLYGTPPENLAGKTIELDIIALNKENYETRHKTLPIFIAQKFPTPNVVEMKIDNLNWVHLMDPGRVENLLNIFRNELWLESEKDLSLIFIESAVNMGGRLPLQPKQREGVIVHVGSFAQFSTRLHGIQEEVKPLYKLRTCPYKRISDSNIFENAGFKLDWCAFKIVGAEISPDLLYHNKNQHSLESEMLKRNRWQENRNLTMMYSDEVPIRNYIDEIAFSFAIPGVLFAIFLAILSFVLCFEHEKFSSSNVISNSHNTSTVHMVQYADDGNNPTSTLKSLKDPNTFLDNTSLRSQSPNSSSFRTEIQTNTYMRPKPPSYKGSTLSRNGVGNI